MFSGIFHDCFERLSVRVLRTSCEDVGGLSRGC
jgi:hypothetical protein